MTDQFNVQPGTVFAGDFRVVRSMSAGGMGAVYVAEQISTGKQRALKVMLPQLVADASLRKRFEQEARIGSLIESEHVVEVVGAGVDQALGLPWLAMELLQGEDLAHVVSKRGPMSVPDVLLVFEQLCHAVGAAHRVGVVHRDLKPENIFLAQTRRAGATFMVKVLDFGIAKIVAESSTKQTAAMGSPIWMAPEQADRSPVTPATDVWALGLIAFFLLTGRPFWRSANDADATIPMVLKEVLFTPIVPASTRTAELGCALPPGFDAWFARCLTREPGARFASAAEAGAELPGALAGGVAVGAVPLPYAATITPAMAGQPLTGPVTPATAPLGPTGPGPMMAATPAPVAPFGVAPVATGVAGAYTVGGPQASPPAAYAPRGSAMPMAAVAVLVLVAVMVGGVVAGGAWWVAKRAGATAPVVVPSAVATADVPDGMGVVLEAKRLCDTGECDVGHQRLAMLPAGSSARGSTEFKNVELRWATDTLLRADRSVDLPTKRALLDAVAQCATVDDAVRASARDRLSVLDSTSPPTAGPDAASVPSSQPSASPSAVVPPSAPAMPAVPGVPAAPSGQAPRTTTPRPGASTPQPAVQAPAKSVYDLATSTSPSDWWTARGVLEPKVQAGTATVDEVRLLDQICRNQHDSACQKLCKKALSAKR